MPRAFAACHSASARAAQREVQCQFFALYSTIYMLYCYFLQCIFYALQKMDAYHDTCTSKMGQNSEERIGEVDGGRR